LLGIRDNRADLKKNKDLQDLIIACLATLVLLKVFYELRKVWVVGDLLWLLVPLTFFLIPYFILRVRGESFASLGIHLRGLKNAIRLVGTVSLVTFPPFVFLFWIWTQMVPRGAVLTMPPLAWVSFVVFQFFYVAIPEELFYRGYVLGKLDHLYPRILSVFRVKVGFGLPLSALLFALGHFLINFSLQRLGVFFPGLIFAWMKEKTGGILAPAIYHALCNILVIGLEQLFF
jgi:membrane protease YdiL (CAAX protease family)